MPKARNVLNGPLETCGTDPMTGFYRTGCCDTGAGDAGIHVVRTPFQAPQCQYMCRSFVRSIKTTAPFA